MLNKKIITTILWLCASCFTLAGITAPAPSAYDVTGKPVYLNERTNKWVVINYWAAWCTACIQEIPELNRFAQMTRNANTLFFAVNFDQMSADSQVQFAHKYGVNYTLLRNNPFRNFVPEDTITSLPMTYVISPQGEVQQLYGAQTAEDLLRITG
jgi:thiol-disulfide isomerase/thioredoxin